MANQQSSKRSPQIDCCHKAPQSHHVDFTECRPHNVLATNFTGRFASMCQLRPQADIIADATRTADAASPAAVGAAAAAAAQAASPPLGAAAAAVTGMQQVHRRWLHDSSGADARAYVTSRARHPDGTWAQARTAACPA